ncbi:hypothetical protein EK904_002890, partial [Melospiza melodia maxima]
MIAAGDKRGESPKSTLEDYFLNPQNKTQQKTRAVANHLQWKSGESPALRAIRNSELQSPPFCCMQKSKAASGQR